MAYEFSERIEVVSCDDILDPSSINPEESSVSNHDDTISLPAEIVSENILKEVGISKSSNWKTTPLGHDSVICCQSLTELPSALISEIFTTLGPKDLGVVSCVSRQLHRIASGHHVWKELYCQRWGIPLSQARCDVEVPENGNRGWRELFAWKESRSKAFLGRYFLDVLRGHTETVRAVFLLESAKLIFTSGHDSVIRVWALEEGLAITCSRPLGSTIRALAADTRLLIAGTTDGFIHGWKAMNDLPHLFDLNVPFNPSNEFRLCEHGGPVTCVALDFTKMYSGSWDMTIRIWDRSSLGCLHTLRHSDWVWNLSAHNTTVASSSGSDIYLWETETGILTALLCNLHTGKIYGLERSHTGNFIFTGGEDGSIHMLKIDGTEIQRTSTWAPHSGPVHSIAFDFPWLVSASCDGRLSLIDVRKLVCKSSKRKEKIEQLSIEPPQRMLHGFTSNLFCVDIGVDRIVCGGDGGVVRIWNFSQALETGRRADFLRGLRLENRTRRRRIQIEMNRKSSADRDQCAVVAAKKGIDNRKRNAKVKAWW